jgi:proteasome lid subunit RPN8/RPN11
MTLIPTGILSHGPWDFDPAWYLGKDYPPPDIRPYSDSPQEGQTAPSRSWGDSCGAEPPLPPPSDPEEEPLAEAWPPILRMLQSAYLAVMRHLTSVPPEAGGMLLGPRGSPVVTHYVPDRNGQATAASFTLDAAGLNRILRRFLDCDLDAKGLVHSHPRGCSAPSFGDLAYVRKVFGNEKNRDLGEFLLPIVCDGELYPYLIRGSDPGRVLPAQLLLL